jgi:hypothetical protein
MRPLERDRADALLEAALVRGVPEISDAPHEEDDDDTTLNGFIGMLAGVMICLPLWAAVAVVVILFLR